MSWHTQGDSSFATSMLTLPTAQCCVHKPSGWCWCLLSGCFKGESKYISIYGRSIILILSGQRGAAGNWFSVSRSGIGDWKRILPGSQVQTWLPVQCTSLFPCSPLHWANTAWCWQGLLFVLSSCRFALSVSSFAEFQFTVPIKL